MFIVKYKAFFIGISALLVVASCVLFGVYGIKKGIDFTGGTTIEISYLQGAPETLDVQALKALNVDTFKTSSSTYKFITTKQYDELGKPFQELLTQGKFAYFETQVNTVGPTLGREMTKKAAIAIVIVILAILAFIAFAFREVSRPVSSWKYGVAAMVTMAHDIIIPTGVYVLLSHYLGAEVNTLFVIALLTVMAVTISDKIVVFDRIRENLKTKKGTFDDIVGISLRQTAVRSINTSLTTVLTLIALYVFGPESTQFFALTLIVGMVVGTYSSICVASPILTLFNKTKK
jgi:preprotein translocase subunit SecF